jgi:NAD+ kinase
MEGKEHFINSETIFSKPFIVYKINNPKAYVYSLKIVEFLLRKKQIQEIYVEDKEINVESIIKYRDSLEITDPKTISELDEELELSKNKIKIFELGQTFPDICIVLGGDGTTLWCNNIFKNYERPPFLTFNLGTLGYMAIYSFSKYEEVLNELFNPKKSISIEKRSMLKCRVNTVKHDTVHLKHSLSECCITTEVKFLKEEVDSCEEVIALNDIVIEKSKNSNMAHLKLYVNDEPLTIVKSDGIILSTSTGSTAYSLSAGGSVIHSDVDAFILNAICPHSLSFRSIIFPRNFKIQIRPCTNSCDKVEIVSDGRRLNDKIGRNQYIEVSLSDKMVQFIVLDDLVPNRTNLWKMKIVDQLGWNSEFQNYE